MARVSKTINHDYLVLRVTFPDGTKANVSWSRNGENVTVTPHSREQAERLSLIVAQNAKLNGMAGYPFKNLHGVIDAMEDCGKSAATLDGFLDGLCATLRVSGERPVPKNAENAPAQTTVQMKQSRGGWHIVSRFPNGESFDLKLNRASISWVAAPAIITRDKEVMNYLFGLLQMGTASDDIAATIKEKAEEAASFDDWFDGLKGVYSPSPRR